MSDRTYLEWPFLDDAHRQLADDLDRWVRAELAHRELHAHDQASVDAICRGLVRRLGQGGWLQYCVPGDAGGRLPRLDVRSLCLVRERLAQEAALADFAFAMQGLGSGPISLYGSAAQRQQYLPPVARGDQIMAFALSEPEAGSDVGAMRTVARQEGQGDAYLLDGCKTWISNGGLANVYVVFARTGPPDSGSRGISAFIVEGDRPGLHVQQRIDLIAPHPLAMLAFNACRVPYANRIGQEGEGFKIAMGTLDVFRSTVAAAALGFARRALDEALARARQRVVFHQPLADFQLTQAKLASMALDVDASALLVYRAAWAKDRGAARITREAAMAKLYATEGAQRVVDQAVQLMGAAGLVSGAPVERLYRDVRALRIYEGTSEIQQLVIARQVLAASEPDAPKPGQAQNG